MPACAPLLLSEVSDTKRGKKNKKHVALDTVPMMLVRPIAH